MSISRSTIVAWVAALTVAGSLSAPSAVMANQGQGQLAQYPLSITNIIPPAFVMAIDDSGSMRFQGLFGGVEASACWEDGSFFSSGAVLRNSGGTCDDPLYYVYTHPGPRVGAAGESGFPPVDTLGFARSHQFNRGYFNPNDTYTAWLNADGSPYGSTAANPQGNASVTATRIDPRQTGTVNLFANRRNTSESTRILDGMVIPSGTVYRRASGTVCGLHSGTNSHRTSLGDNWWRLDVDRTISGNCNNVYFEYYPATFYLRTNTPAAQQPAGYRTTAAHRPVVANACGPGCNMWKYTITADNFTSAAAFTAMRQNFANWFSFYGNRNRAMIAGMTQAFVDVTNLRLGYFTINNIPAGNLTMYDLAAQGDKETVFSDMLNLPSVGGTPNPNALRYASEQFLRTDANAPVQLSCQKNATLLFTDGFSNTTNVTNAQAPEITGLGEPFDPTPARSMAAIASRYYFNTNNTVGTGGTSRLPLPTGGTAGQVPVPDACANPPSPLTPAFKRLNCQSNLHVNFFGIVLGPSGELFNPTEPKDPFVDDLGGDWPGYEAAQPSTIDDIWHAAINTRGEFIDAATPTDITLALRRVLSAVGGGESPSGSIALTGARVGDGGFTVEPSFESRSEGTDWFGRLTGYELELTDEGAFEFAQLWEASSLIPAAGVRNIWFARPSGSTTNPTVQAFTADNLGTTNQARLARLCDNPGLSRCTGPQIAALRSPALTPELAVSYLRGDQSLEAAGTLRQRTTRLGDIVNSTPTISEKTDNYGYRSLRPAAAGTFDPLGYGAYLESKSSGTRPRMVYVGANDGMLHAFDGATGVEQFAFIPSVALGHMGNLLFPYRQEDQQDQRFQHRYFVDGPLTVSDVRRGGQWSTALVGSTGAGGRSVFALDVTNPQDFSADHVIWEITPSVAGDAGNYIGHVLGKPLVVPVRDNGQTSWKALFGNGYGSAAGEAALFVVDMASGTVEVIPAVEANGDGPDHPNGLGNIVAIDRYDSVSGDTPVSGTDGLVDTVYGGDLHGNVWKFDLRDGAVAFSGSPLFTAVDEEGERQPITGGLEAAAGPGGGVMLYFGTGSFSFQNDAVDSSVQSLYGVLDAGEVVAGRAELREQVITATADEGLRNISGNSVNFLDQSGWYIDLAPTVGDTPMELGERFVGTPRISEGTLFFPTFEPGGSNAQTDPCAPGGRNWLYAVNALNGGAAMRGLRVGAPDADALASGAGGVLLATAGSSPIKDVAVALVPQIGPVPSDATAEEIAAALAQTCDKVITTAGGFVAYQARACGRQSWRQIR